MSMNAKLLDRWANITMFVFNGGSIMLVAFDHMLLAGISGLLSEPAFAYFSWKARSWALGALTAWWTGWWAIVLLKAL
jgi:hypothetical protein